jgi:membrane protein implicated in regulation of membrane protease activity
MTGGQFASMIFGLILLLPGGCFLFVGWTMLTDTFQAGAGPPLLIIAFLILGVAALCFWIAFRRRDPPPTEPTV